MVTESVAGTRPSIRNNYYIVPAVKPVIGVPFKAPFHVYVNVPEPPAAVAEAPPSLSPLQLHIRIN